MIQILLVAGDVTGGKLVGVDDEATDVFVMFAVVCGDELIVFDEVRGPVDEMMVIEEGYIEELIMFDDVGGTVDEMMVIEEGYTEELIMFDEVRGRLVIEADVIGLVAAEFECELVPVETIVDEIMVLSTDISD